MIRLYEPFDFGGAACYPGFDSARLMADGPSAHIVHQSGHTVDACCSVWWEGTPTDRGAPAGTIGHFHANSAAAAERVLAAACERLDDAGCSRVLAPMNGNTWREYRYAVSGTDRPPFFMEPPPAQGRDAFLAAAGFAPRQRYVSFEERLTDDSAAEDARARLEADGISIRPLDTAAFDEALDAIYAVSLRSFAGNPYYTDLPRAAFIGQYRRLKDAVDPALVLFAYDGTRPVGFMFGIPDYAMGPKPDTVLLKTIAVLPDYRGRGVGHVLIDLARRHAFQAGYAYAIGALVHEDNISRRLCAGASLLREYRLYGKDLT